MASVRVEGLAELEAALAELPKATGKNVLKRVLMAAAAPIEAEAAAAAPHFTGRLRRDVATGTRLTRRQAGLARKLGRSEVEVHVGVKDPAGIQNEFGNIHQRAQPFLRPAWDANKDGALQTIASQLGEEIEKSAARLARRAARRAKVQGV
jgi:HK97 gp10 family phage protein